MIKFKVGEKKRKAVAYSSELVETWSFLSFPACCWTSKSFHAAKPFENFSPWERACVIDLVSPGRAQAPGSLLCARCNHLAAWFYSFSHPQNLMVEGNVILMYVRFLLSRKGSLFPKEWSHSSQCLSCLGYGTAGGPGSWKMTEVWSLWTPLAAQFRSCSFPQLLFLAEKNHT